ncbi:MAG: hypothetical protein JW891_10305 [Candidatus Lokiarchaeota archaeon]|nr:hypothetical protein [Candidatus Lokiarchaeota archaeon]
MSDLYEQKQEYLDLSQKVGTNSTVAEKLQGKVRVKQREEDISIESDFIALSKNEYIKLLGITSVNRTQLYHNSDKYIYFLELTNNLDFIATSILGGELDKMTLISEKTHETEKILFLVKNDIIFLVYGIFPDKKASWILEQMHKYFMDLVRDKKIDDLTKYEKHQITLKFNSILKFILREYTKIQDVFSDQEIPYVENKLKVHYFGLSSRSIGVISLLFGDELHVEFPGNFDSPEEIQEMKESMLTAKIEAIAANTLGNTGATPRWIAVKLGFQNYRFLTFKKLQNDYYASLLSEGNLGKLEKMEAQLEPLLKSAIKHPFSGNLKPFNQLKTTMAKKFKESREFF